jgi:hypothetical protein
MICWRTFSGIFVSGSKTFTMLTSKPTGLENEIFDAWWNWVKINLENLLRINILDTEERASKLSVVKLHKLSLSDHQEGMKSGVLHLGILIRLIDDLDYIQMRNFQLFESFCKKLVSGIANQFSYLLGHGFEVKITRLLLEQGFNFDNPDPPDFSIEYQGHTIGIECYAPKSLKNKEYFLKIFSRKVKPYRNSDWINQYPILFVDITIWRIFENQNDPIISGNGGSDILEKVLKELFHKTFYKLVVFFQFGYPINYVMPAIAISCQWSPSINLEPILKEFTEKLFLNYKEEKIDIILPSLPIS